MSERTDQLAAIKTLMEGVTDIGLIHTYPRYGDAAEHWVTNIDGRRVIRAWEIGHGEEETRVERLSQGWRHRYRPWRIQGYVGLEDDEASYNTILDLAGSIADAIDADPTLAGTCLYLHNLDAENAVQVGAPGALVIGGAALCWGITLDFTAYTVVS